MRSILFLVQNVFLFILYMNLFSCSEPLFWVVSREEPISKNNLPKDSQISGIIFYKEYYYASVGISLWRRPINNNKWAKVTLPVKGLLGVSQCENNICVGTYKGIYQSSNGITYTKIQGLDKPTLTYSYVNNSNAIKSLFFSLGDDNSIGQYNTYTLEQGSLQLAYKINGAFTGIGNLGISSNNAIFEYGNTSLQAKTIFEWVSGYSNNYLYADGFIGIHDGITWTKKVSSGHSSNRGSTILDYSKDDIKALFSIYELGYFEVYEEGSTLKIRPPTKTVKSKESYQVSDLAFATITGFYKAPNKDLFAMTSRKGLWRNTKGVWFLE